MAFEYPENLKYLDSHEYARVDEEEEDLVVVGVTAFAIDQLGEIVFLDLPEIGDSVEKGESFGDIESVKAVEKLKSPVTGEVVERNDVLLNTPEDIGNDPYGDGWLIKVKAKNLEEELEDAMSSQEYKLKVEG